MAIPESSVMQLSFRGRFANQRILHVRTFQLVTGGTATGTPQQYQNDFGQVVAPGGDFDLTTPYAACLSAGWSLEDIRMQIIWPQRFAYTLLTPEAPVIGGRAATGNGLLAGMIEGSTSLAGRSEVACYKIGPIAATDTANGLTVNALADLLDAYSETFLNPIAVGGTRPAQWASGIYHKGRTPPADEFTFFIQADPYEEVRGKTTRTVRRGE